MAKIEGYHLQQTGDEVQEILNTPVKTIQQTLTEGQKAQARENIGATSSAVSITYSNLVTLRTDSNLVPGQYYRITDYVTTTADAESRSVGHLFDVIVLALDESHLSEEAFATHHDGDTYFANSALDAWRIWYCLDNDTTRFAWADTTNGKGVIYRMVDEWANDLPYDFKNIQFKRFKVAPATGYETVLANLDGLYLGYTNVSVGLTIDTTDFKWCYTFHELTSSWDDGVDASLTGVKVAGTEIGVNRYSASARILNKVVFLGGAFVQGILRQWDAEGGSDNNMATNNHFAGESCIDITFFGTVANNFAQSEFRQNVIAGIWRHNTTSTDTQDNTIIATRDNAFNFLGGPFSHNVIRCKDFALNEIGTEFMRNTINVTGLLSRNHIVSQFQDNNISCSTFTGNYISYRFRRNTISGDWRNNEVYVGQVDDNEFLAPMLTCQITGILSFVTIPVGQNNFGNVEIKSLRGASASSRITLGASDFYLASFAGVKRRIIIEGASDDSIVATWKGTDGKPVGIRSTDNGTTWEAYSPAPTDVVKYTAQSLTAAQKLQARINIGVEDSVLVSSLTDYPEPYDLLNPKTLAQTATAFGVSESEIIALSEGKYSQIKFGDNVLGIDSIKVTEGLDPGEPWTIVYFGTTVGQSTLTSTKVLVFIWDNAERTSAMTLMRSVENENITYKCTSWQNNPDDTHYPSEKLVKDSLDAKYTKPSAGIPASDLANGVIPDVSQFITKSVSDLTNYYLKSETYTKDEVAALIGAIQQFHYEIVATLPATGEGNVLYLVGPTGSGSDRYEEYVYANNQFTKIGDTSIDLSGYVTTTALNTALAAYTTSADLTTLLAGKQDVIDSNHKLSYSLISDTPEIPTVESMTSSEITAAVNTAWNNVMS